MRELVQAALLGDWKAFSAVVRKYASVLHTLQKPEMLGSWLEGKGA
jgi:hypothetical protein